jgi:putative transposase
MKAYKFEIQPNNEQKELLEKHFGACRFVYNFGLTKKIETYQKEKKTINCFALMKDLTEMKKQEDKQWLNEINSQALQQSLRNLDNAFTSFFRGNGGFPKLKSKKKSRASFQCPQGVKIDFDKWLLKLPKFKHPLKICADRGGLIFNTELLKTVTVSKTRTGRYFISCIVDEDMSQPNKKPVDDKTTIGLDLGLKHFCVASNNTKVGNPKFYAKAIDKLAVLQRRLSKKQKQSKRYENQQKKITKLHEHIAWQRRDFLNKISYNFVSDKQVSTICMEDLNVSGMLKNRKLSRHISDAGWYTFKQMIEYKCDWLGKNFVQINRFEPSSKLCSICGYHKADLKLSDREWECPTCKTKHDRDINASVNIKNFGLIKLQGGEGNPRCINKALPMDLAVVKTV